MRLWPRTGVLRPRTRLNPHFGSVTFSPIRLACWTDSLLCEPNGATRHELREAVYKTAYAVSKDSGASTDCGMSGNLSFILLSATAAASDSALSASSFAASKFIV